MKRLRRFQRKNRLAIVMPILAGLITLSVPAEAQTHGLGSFTSEIVPARAGAPVQVKESPGELKIFCLSDQLQGENEKSPLPSPTVANGQDGKATPDRTAEPEPDRKATRVNWPMPDLSRTDQPAQQYPLNGGFRWNSALKQSLLFLTIEHGFRLGTEPSTRADLKGPFFKDWFKSASNLRDWRDGDEFYVNYVGHPMQGAVTGFIQIQNDPHGISQQIGLNKAYWESRRRAFWWSAAYSTQFELGPLSESSIGNVGLRPSVKSRHPQAFVDIVITPVVGTAWLVGEDALDRFLIRQIEDKTTNRVIRIFARSLLNPGRSFANLMRGRWFWYRDDRKL